MDVIDGAGFDDAVEQRIAELTAEDGRYDAKVMRSFAVGGPIAGDSYLQESFGNLALVSVYGTYAQREALEMPESGAVYLTAMYDELGGDGGDDATMDVADWLSENDQADDWMTQAYADGILVLSDSRLDDDFGFQAVPQGIWDAIDDIPEQKIDKDFGIVGEYDGVTRTGGKGFFAFAELMSHATAEPGLVLAGEMAEGAGELAGRIAEGHPSHDGYEKAVEEWGPLMQTVLEVSSRNEEANEWLLARANDDEYPEVAERLTNLYTFPWPDDGEAVAGYTDWIADARACGDPDRVELAEQASASFIDFLTDTGGD